MLPNSQKSHNKTSIALKEWAVTSGALGRGEQIFMLRKGGIREDGRHFMIEHEQFLLYPGLFHEIYNEPERATVLDDLIGWFDAHVKGPGAA